MIIEEFINRMEQIANPALAESWDNVGLMCGNAKDEIRKVMICLDVTDEVIDIAIKEHADLILSHHPLVFTPVNRVTAGTGTSGRLYRLIRNNIACYSMHTNFDSSLMADICAQKLGLTDIYPMEPSDIDDNAGIGMIGDFMQPVDLFELARRVKDVFDIDSVRVYESSNRPITKAALLPGSGKGYVNLALSHDADVFITGDLGHHDCLDAAAQGLAVIDASHYGLEKVFISYMEDFISENMPELAIADYYQNPPFVSV